MYKKTFNVIRRTIGILLFFTCIAIIAKDLKIFKKTDLGWNSRIIQSTQVDTVSGIIEVDETWSDSVLVAGNITVLDGVTLTIMPGTYIQLESDYELIVEGTLKAEGTEADSPPSNIKTVLPSRRRQS